MPLYDNIDTFKDAVKAQLDKLGVPANRHERLMEERYRDFGQGVRDGLIVEDCFKTDVGAYPCAILLKSNIWPPI